MKNFKEWFSTLSKGAQVAVVSVGIILGLGTYGSIAAPAPSSTTSGEVESAATRKVESRATTETAIETEAVPFSKRTVETSSLHEGISQVTAAGMDGVRTKTYTVTKTDGLETSRVLVSNEITSAPVDEVTSVGTYVAPPPPSPRASNGCDPNYSGGCVPIVSYDLDCPDIGFSVTIVGTDLHGFDGNDNDGYGCESY